MSVVLAGVVVGIHLYQVYTPNERVEAYEVIDPVETNKNNYKAGETVYGKFEGERYVSLPTIFNRTLVCRHRRALLKPIRSESPPLGKFSGKNSPIIVLNDDMFADETIKLFEAKSCEIIFDVDTVVQKYLLGGEETQAGQSYRTTNFNIEL